MSHAAPSGEGLTGNDVERHAYYYFFRSYASFALPVIFAPRRPRKKNTGGAGENGYNKPAHERAPRRGIRGRWARPLMSPVLRRGGAPKIINLLTRFKTALWETLRPATSTAAYVSGEPVKPLEALSACYIVLPACPDGRRLASSIFALVC